MKLRALAVLALLASPAFATDPQFGGIRVEAAQNITHATVITGTQGSTQISKNEWNAAHTAPATTIFTVPTGIVWPAMPAAATEFCGVTSYRWRANLTSYSTIRLTAQVLSAGPASSALRLQYTTDLTGASGWDYMDGASGPSVAITAAGVAVSSSVNLATAAKADVLLRLVTINGDGGGGTCYNGFKSLATLADTATALAGNGTNCSAGEAPRGVDASGASENCTAYQAADADLTTYAGITPSANVQSLLGAANYSAMRTQLSLVPGSDVEVHDADLTTIAGLTATTDNFLQSKSSAWSSRTPTQVTADLISMVGDSGSGGTKGLAPAPGAGDTAAGKFLKANGTWAVPAGGVSVGGAVGSGTGGRILYEDPSNLLAESTNLRYDGTTLQAGSASTASNSILKMNRTIGGASLTDNFFNLTGSFPASAAAAMRGAVFDFTTGDADDAHEGVYVHLGGVGATGEPPALSVLNDTTATSRARAGIFSKTISPTGGTYPGVAVHGLGTYQGDTAPQSVGVWGQAEGGNTNSQGPAIGSLDSAYCQYSQKCVGAWVTTANVSIASPLTEPSTTTALVVDTTGSDRVASFRDGAAVIYSIEDGGQHNFTTDASRSEHSGSKALTESTATAFVNVAIPSGSEAGGSIDYLINADDSTDFQGLKGVVGFNAENKAGTVNCTIVDPAGNQTNRVSSGTLTNTMTCVANGNSIDIKANAVSSLTQTTLNVKYFIRKLNGTGAITPQ